MGRDDELIRLEVYVGRLLDEFSHLRVEKERLEQELQEKHLENKHLKQALDSVDSERLDVSDRVSTLIERLEQWESELEGDVSTDGSLRSAMADDEVPDRDEADQGDGEDGGTVQKNLFNA